MDIINTRFKLAAARIKEIAKESRQKGKEGQELYKGFCEIADHYTALLKLLAVVASDDKFEACDSDKLKKLYDQVFASILPRNYETGYANPAYAVKMLGAKNGKLMTILAADAFDAQVHAFSGNTELFTMYLELFIEIYCIYESHILPFGDREAQLAAAFDEAKQDYRAFRLDNILIFLQSEYDEKYDSTGCRIRAILDSDMSDEKYLYRYGEYITENNLESYRYLKSQSAETIRAMAETTYSGYLRGFTTMSANFKEKGITGLHYPIGFELMAKELVILLEKRGNTVVMYQDSFRNRTGRLRGCAISPVNPQFSYDHRNDHAFWYDKVYAERFSRATEVVCEEKKEVLAKFNGPVLVESFGEKEFNPINKKECLKLSKSQNLLKVQAINRISETVEKYMPEEESSFCIIAYPLPSIGSDYHAIFEETIKINNLSNEEYQKIQQAIIDVLDKGVAAHIKGRNGNETDLTVALWPLKDPKKETVFENCTADVNIPVGEVFTSPVLKGTNGLLHVKRVFLKGYEYKNLRIWFKDGMTEKLSCENFKTEKENQDFLAESLLFYHDSIPMGEFAIGTNTRAFKMAEKYGIQSKLPILIAEKTGPHFAIGDTCYSHAEDHKVYNPDGKEIVARENECAALRNTDPQKAYFNCHTDITIPYDDLAHIVSVRADGSTEAIISEGRFVVKGALALNKALEEN